MSVVVLARSICTTSMRLLNVLAPAYSALTGIPKVVADSVVSSAEKNIGWVWSTRPLPTLRPS
jgi:hypothetical protein